jgi:hypothetical protein
LSSLVLSTLILTRLLHERDVCVDVAAGDMIEEEEEEKSLDRFSHFVVSSLSKMTEEKQVTGGLI